MKIATVAIGLSCVFAGADGTGSPMEKAVQMLGDLKDSLEKDAEKEDKQFEATTEWCKHGAKDLRYEISVDKTDVEDLSATIAKAESDMSTSASKIEDVAASQSQAEAELQAAKAIREKEHHQFVGTEAELADSIDTLERAGNVLQRKMRGTALVETTVNRKDIKDLINTIGEVVNAASLSLHDQKSLMSLAQSGEDESDDLGEFSAAGKGSGSVLDLLEDLKQKAEKQLSELRAEETNARHNFEMVQASLGDQIKFASKEIAQAKGAKAGAMQTKATSQGELSVTNTDLKNGQQDLGDLDRACVDKAQDYDANVKSRGEELNAVKSALKALQAATGGAAASLLEIKSSPDRYKVVNLLRALAQRQRNAALTQLAGRVSTVVTQAVRRQQADPFKKVSEMINGMVERLEKEGKEAASHKAYCDQQKRLTAEKKDDLQYSTEKQNAQADKAKAKVAGLRDQVSTLQKELAQMASQQSTADEIRQEEKSTYEETKGDLQHGARGMAQALKVLHKHYGTTSKDAEGAIKAIFALLETVEEDISKELADIDQMERSSASAYDKITKETQIARKTKENNARYKTKEAKSIAKSVTEYNSDLEAMATEMDAIMEYSNTIQDQCEQKPESFADKQARREEELAGLNEAMDILKGQAAFLQRRAVSAHSLRGVVQH